MKYQKLIFIGVMLAMTSCRSGHFENTSLPAVPQSIERPAGPEPEIISVIADDVTSRSFNEKSTSMTEIGILVQIQAKSSRETPLKERKLSYQVSFPSDPGIPTVEGSAATNESGQISLNLSVPFYQLEDERIQIVKLAFHFAGQSEEKSGTGPYAEINLPLDFDTNPMKPLLPSASLAVSHLRSEPKHLVLSAFSFEENVDRSQIRVDSQQKSKYVPLFEGSAELSITRMRFGKSEPELRQLKLSKIRGRLFAYEQSLIQIEIIYEKFLDLSSDMFGRIQFSAEPEFDEIQYKKGGIRWIFAFELPDFPKIGRSFFIFDPSTSQLKAMNEVEATEKLGRRAFDIGIPPTPKTQKSSASLSDDRFPLFTSTKSPLLEQGFGLRPEVVHDPVSKRIGF